jgi:hypothetical protein
VSLFLFLEEKKDEIIVVFVVLLGIYGAGTTG